MCWSHEKLQSEKVTLLKSLRPLAVSVAGPRLKKGTECAWCWGQWGTEEQQILVCTS